MNRRVSGGRNVPEKKNGLAPGSSEFLPEFCVKMGTEAGWGLGAGTITLCRTNLCGVVLNPVIPVIEPETKGEAVRRLGIVLILEKPGFPCGNPAAIRVGRTGVWLSTGTAIPANHKPARIIALGPKNECMTLSS
jgi:hypothetical protein